MTKQSQEQKAAALIGAAAPELMQIAMKCNNGEAGKSLVSDLRNVIAVLQAVADQLEG